MKKIILFVLTIIVISACSNDEKITKKEEEVFIDKGISVFADNNPNNDVMMQAFWWDSYSDSKISSYNSYYDFIKDKIIDLEHKILIRRIVIDQGFIFNDLFHDTHPQA